jgi:colanic acid/amylovoran biosynthesis glycosyltransferase
MRIAFLLDRFPVVSETFVIDQVTALLDLGHEVDIYARWRPDPAAPVHPAVCAYGLLERTTYVDELLPPASGYWELSAFPAEGRTWLPGADAPIENRERLLAAASVIDRCRTVAADATAEVLDVGEYGYQSESLSALYRLDALACLGRSYDVLHAHFGPAGNTFRFARLLWQAPLVVTFHGYDHGAFVRTQPADFYDGLFRAASLVTVNSRYSSARVRRLGCPEDRLEVLPVGVDVEASRTVQRQRPGPDAPLRVLAVARLVPIKGLCHLIEAVASAARKRGVRLDVVGDGPLREELEALARRVAPVGAVRFHGALEARGVRSLLGRCDVFVLPSVEVDGDAESQGLVLQEAQAAGVPVLSTATGGIPEGVADRVSGILVPPADPEALSAALLELAAAPATRRSMGRAGRRFVEENFDQRKLTLRLVELYHRVIAHHRSAEVAT